MDKKSRKHLSAESMIGLVAGGVRKLPHQIKGTRNDPITIYDCIMTGLAIFSLKWPSLLAFQTALNKETISHNLKKLFLVNHIPCDTYLRERLDEVNPRSLRNEFKAIFAEVQKGKVLEQFIFMKQYYIISVDGTGFFNSTSVHCPNCAVKNHRNGITSYYHDMCVGALVHPDMKMVIPLAPEPVMRAECQEKNDCESNAMRRFIQDLKREHPHLKLLITADSLHSKSPFIRQLQDVRYSFILNAKPGDHLSLFEFVKDICEQYVRKDRNGKTYEYRYANNVPLNDANQDIQVNFLECVETNAQGKSQRFSWVTNLVITEENIHDIMKGGRARWKIENETFNTLKNQGYAFEHNFGHGNKNLSSIFAMLMLLAFLIDQVQELCDALFKMALAKEGRRSYLWNLLRTLFSAFLVESWAKIWAAIAHGYQITVLNPNSS